LESELFWFLADIFFAPLSNCLARMLSSLLSFVLIIIVFTH